MAVSDGSSLGFRFIEQRDFDLLVSTQTLVPGYWYFVDNVFHIASTPESYQTYGANVHDIVNEIIQNEYLQTEIANVTQQITNDLNALITNNFVEQITENIVNQSIAQITAQIIADVTNQIIDNTTQQIITNIYEQISENTAEQAALITQQVITNIYEQIDDDSIISFFTGKISLVAPDGSTIAENNDGKLTVQAATNSQFGIVKGQTNTSPSTWGNVSAEHGTLSVHRELAESIMDIKDTAVKNAVNVKTEDGCITGQNMDGMITLPIRFAETEPNNPVNGTLYLVKEDNAVTP